MAKSKALRQRGARQRARQARSGTTEARACTDVPAHRARAGHRGAAGRPGMPSQVAGGVPTSCGRRRRRVGPRRQPGLAQHQRPLPLPLYARAYGGRQLRGLRRRALVLRRRHRQPSPRVRARAPRAATWSYNPDSLPQST